MPVLMNERFGEQKRIDEATANGDATSLRKVAIAVLALLLLTGTTGVTSGHRGTPTWRLSDTGVTARFRGLAPVSAAVAWVAGSAGTVLRTVDGGRTWRSVGPPAAAELQFRDIEAFDRDHAVALTIGEGDQSRVYVTADGGRTWAETFRNDEPAAFYDWLAAASAQFGLTTAPASVEPPRLPHRTVPDPF